MNQSDINLVHFPAIIKLHADDELILIADKSTFENTQNLKNMYFQPQDIVIDKRGHIFKIEQSQHLVLSKTCDVMQLEDIIKLIQLHLSNDQTCCVSKFSAHSIQDALEILASSQD